MFNGNWNDPAFTNFINGVNVQYRVHGPWVISQQYFYTLTSDPSWHQPSLRPLENRLIILLYSVILMKSNQFTNSYN